ncbi:MAG: DUF3592 domain-containing protein [Clostridia bacterium]|nr:DUF3592 domain-containing protein [Clostridia bacterium]
MDDWKKIVIVGLVAATFIVVALFMFLRKRKIKKNGLTATAVVTHIEERESYDSDTGTTVNYEYYVTYFTADGETVDARLDNPPRRTNVGDQLKIKYLPEKPHYVVAIKEKNKDNGAEAH